MSRRRPGITASALMWFGLLAPPFAWTLQHVAGFGLTVAGCDKAARAAGSDIHVDAWTAIVSGGAVVVTMAGLVAAIVSWRRTRDVGTEPPGARVHFLTIIALTTTPLFLAIMLMSGAGVLSLTGCAQS